MRGLPPNLTGFKIHCHGLGLFTSLEPTADETDRLLRRGKVTRFTRIVVTDDEIVVESSSVVSMIVQAQGNTAKAVHGLSMTRSSIELHKFAASPWVRVTVIDAAGKRAWSNPIWR